MPVGGRDNMFLTPEQQELGRRTFLKALAGTPALGLLAAAATTKGPVPGGPVRLGVIGVGGQGRALLNNVDPAFGEVCAICDINPASLMRADEAMQKKGMPKARHYVEWADLLQKEDVEAVLVAVPLWQHADVTVGCLDAGKHVLCEKMMAWDVDGCERMTQAAARNRKVLEIGYQRRYNGVYQSAFEGIVQPGLLGDVYHVRMVWHRNGNWRRKGEPPVPDYDASKWGYPSFDHLWNWRLYLEILAGPDGGARQPPVERGELVSGIGANRGHRQRRHPQVQRRPGSPRPHLFDVGVPRRPYRDVLVGRVQRLRESLRGLLRHEGDIARAE